jgi:tetratricopeptide (TPR) repeat protein
VLFRQCWPALLALALALATPLRARGADHAVEIQARKAFVAGEYDKAIDLFAGLYAETLHPVYLRNLGRCHQKLGRPGKAIEFFRDYLRKGQSITPEERKEIQGYIAEMETLRQQQERDAARKAEDRPSNDPARRVITLPPAGAAAAHQDEHGAPLVVVAQAAPAESGPVYSRWWFWTALGVVAAGATTAAILSRRSSVTKPPCPTECYGP